MNAATSDARCGPCRYATNRGGDRLGLVGNLGRLVKTIIHGYSAKVTAGSQFRPSWGVSLQSGHSSTSGMTFYPEESFGPLSASVDTQAGGA